MGKRGVWSTPEVVLSIDHAARTITIPGKNLTARHCRHQRCTARSSWSFFWQQPCKAPSTVLMTLSMRVSTTKCSTKLLVRIFRVQIGLEWLQPSRLMPSLPISLEFQSVVLMCWKIPAIPAILMYCSFIVVTVYMCTDLMIRSFTTGM